MLKAHLNAVEAQLLATSKIPANSGHSLHKGTPREAFIKEFLESHLSERVAIGSGEIIDANSAPNRPRRQIDIVVYKRDFPKLSFGGGVSGFLVESVVAAIEVKSTLTQAELEKAIGAARDVKALTPNLVRAFSAGYVPPSVLSFVVAYDGPASMKTVHGWLAPTHQSLGVTVPTLPATGNARAKVPSPSVDGVFVLGKGLMHFDNSPVNFVSDTQRAQAPNARWVVADMATNNLLVLFTMLTQAVSGVSGSWLNPVPYLSRVQIPGFTLSP